MNGDDLRRVADDPTRPELTRRAAREALEAIARVDVRLALDAGGPTVMVERAPGEWTCRIDARATR